MTALRAVTPEARPYIEAFAAPAGEPAWLAEGRRRGLSRFAEVGFPSRRSEAWRYVDLRALAERPLVPARPSPRREDRELRARVVDLACPGAGQRVVLVDGRFAAELSHVERAPGLW